MPKLILVFGGRTLILLVLSCPGSFLYVIKLPFANNCYYVELEWYAITCNSCLVRTTSDVYISILYSNKVFARSQGHIGEFISLIHLLAADGRLGGAINKHGEETRTGSSGTNCKLGLGIWKKKASNIRLNISWLYSYCLILQFYEESTYAKMPDFLPHHLS